jgi:hypothetical protein
LLIHGYLHESADMEVPLRPAWCTFAPLGSWVFSVS